MSGDYFTKSNDVKQNISEHDDGNFFLNAQKTRISTPAVNENARHLNDYDFNILRDNAYKDVTDEVFKLEYKIAKAQNDIEEYDAKIQAAKEIRDFNLAETLFDKKKIVQEDLKALIEIYNDKSLSSKITSGIASKFKINNNKNFIERILEKFISKLPKQFSSILEIKQSLSKLKNISKNVDELISMQIPYGEASAKYDQLSKYIVKANIIQSELSKFVK